MASYIQQYKRREGTSNIHGPKFEMDLTCLTYVRCYKLYKENKIKTFMIANNMDHVGAFDDVVCRIEYEENGSLQTRLIFVQLKHCSQASSKKFSDFTFFNSVKHKKNKHGKKGARSKIERDHVGTDTKEENEGKDSECELLCNKEMLKYIESYLTIRKIFYENEKCTSFTEENKLSHEMKEARIKLKDVFNCQLNQCLFLYYTNAEKVDRMKYLVRAENINIITDIFDTSSKTGLQKLRLETKELGDILTEKYKDITEEERMHLNEFTSNFSIYSNQEKRQSLEEIIKNEIKSYTKENFQIVASMYQIIYEEIQHIFRLGKGPFLTEKANLVGEIHSLVQLQSLTTKVEGKYMKWLEIISADAVDNLHKDFINRKHVTIPCNTYTKNIVILLCIQLIEEMRRKHKGCKKGTESVRDEKLDVLFLYIENSASYELWQCVRNLYNYKKYSDVILCTEKEIADDAQRVISEEDCNRESIISFDDSKHDVHTPYVTLFSCVGIEIFLKQAVKFQGLDSSFREIFCDTHYQDIFKNVHCNEMLDILVSRVLNEEDINIGSSLPVEEDIYIERKYKKCNNLLKYESISKCKDTFIIFPKHIVPKSSDVEHRENIITFENKEEAINCFESQAEGTEGKHFCLATDNCLEVLSSKGNCKDSSIFATEQEEKDEKTFLQHILRNRFTILSDDVGMGKSTALKRLTHLIKYERKEYWALLVDLSTQSKNLTTFRQTKNPIEFIATNILKLNHMSKMIFRYKCNTEGNVALLFDGFDEIGAEYRKCFLNFVQSLSDSKIKTIVIATRTIVSGELKDCLQTAFFSLLGFTYEDMTSYLIQVWSIKGFEGKYNELRNLVSKIVEHVRENKKTLTAVASVPLQTKMLALTYIDKVSEVLSTENETNFDLRFLNLFSLYNNFINMHIKRFIDEKYNLSESSVLYHTIEDMYKSETEKWEALACKEIFPTVKMCELKTTDADLQKIQHIGIIINKEPIKFVHRSFAEFLAAKYVSRSLYKSSNTTQLNIIYQTICVDETFIVLRKFMNAYYENERHWEAAIINCVVGFVVDDKLLMTAAKEGNPYLFKAILSHLSKNETFLQRIFNYKTDRKENLLHISAEYCEQVFDDTLNSKYFHCAKDCNYYCQTALHMACKYGKENAVKSYLNKFKNESLSAIISQTDSGMDTPLMLAAREGHTKILKILHQLGASIHGKDRRAQTALMYAAEGGHIETVKYLIEQHAEVNDRDTIGSTVLMYAVEYGHIETVKYLIEQDADVNVKNDDGMTALMYAAMNDHIETVKFLVGQFEIEVLSAIIDQTNNRKYTPLMFAARGGHTNIVKILHHHGASIHSEDETARTALHIAAIRGQIETVKYLIEQHAKVNETDLSGWTALMYACKNIHNYEDGAGFIKYLLEQAGADVNIQDRFGRTAAIHLIDSHDKIDILKCLIQHGAHIKAADSEGRNAAMHASKYRRIETLKYLFELLSGDINQVDSYGNTCLTLCAGAEYSSVLKYFIEEHNPNLDHQNNKGETALFRAVSERRFDNVKLLVTHGASVNIVNKNGDNVLCAAIYKYVKYSFVPSTWYSETFHSVVKYAVEHGTNINHQNHLKNSPLHLVLHKVPDKEDAMKFITWIKFLIVLGADIHLKNKDDVTPAMLAVTHRNLEVRSYFQTLMKSKASSS